MLSIKDNLNKFEQLLTEVKNIVITTHYQPDGDAIGSSLGLAFFLKKRGYNVQVIVPNSFNDSLQFLEGTRDILVFQSKPNDAIKISDKADLIFCLDFNSLSRLHDYATVVGRTSAKRVMIDHHPQPDDFADFHLWDDKVASTAELIFTLIELMDGTDELDTNIAAALYTGILTDTGMFQYPATTANTHRIAARLMETGISINNIFNHIFNSYSEQRLRLLGYCISEKLVVLPELKAAYISLSKEEVKRFDVKSGDTEGLVNYPLKINGILFSTLIIDREEKIKISFRSIRDFDVNEFARKNFEGGGHKNAAGGQSKLSMEDTVQKFLRTLERYKPILENQN